MHTGLGEVSGEGGREWKKEREEWREEAKERVDRVNCPIITLINRVLIRMIF
jgi:hypothetical protein